MRRIKCRNFIYSILEVIIILSVFTSIIEIREARLINTDNTLENFNNQNINNKFDCKFVYNLTAALSNIIFSEYNEKEGEIAKGRAFGTKGEHKAAEIIFENMTDLGLYTKIEKIRNIHDLPDIASKFEIVDYEMTIKNITFNHSEKIDCYMAPTWRGPRDKPNQVNHNFSYKGLKIKTKQDITFPSIINSRDSINEEDYILILEDNEYNPNVDPSLMKKILDLFLSPYSDPVLFWDGLKFSTKLNILYNYFPACKGIILYDFNNDTHNMINSINWNLPVLFINGTIGKKIMKNIDNITVDYYLNQRFNESVISYNVIGQLNGTDNKKIVIIDSLYDSWWNQGTADSAIGMSMVLGVAKYFLDNNIIPRYTIKFIAFCGEEYGYRGAKYYEATHKDENIIYLLDLNQLGFTQDNPKLYLEIISNDFSFLNDIWSMVNRTDYIKKTDSKGIRKFWMPFGAPSNDQPFARNRPNCKTVCFLKGLNWKLHHRDGVNHTEGDVLKYFNWNDVNTTGEIIINITRSITI